MATKKKKVEVIEEVTLAQDAEIVTPREPIAKLSVDGLVNLTEVKLKLNEVIDFLNR